MEPRVTVNPDLKKERSGVDFNPVEMSYILYGGKDQVDRRRFIENLALTDPVFNGPEYYFQSLADTYGEGVRKEIHLNRRMRQLDLTEREDQNIFTNAALNGEGTALAFHQHRLAFVPVIKNQGTEDQCKKWLPLIDNFQVFGSYSQTELGHGSSVRFLESTAVYEPFSEEFVLNTPSLTATKWWPGNLGKTSNHTVFIAQTITKGTYVGLQAFIVPLRDTESHSPLKGVTIGSNGPSVGICTEDDGFLRLQNVRVPRENMLARFSQIEANGTFRKADNQRVLYSGMMSIRATLPRTMAFLTASACIIATRYSLVRRQSELEPGFGEVQVLDFQMQQHKVFPAISMAYCFWVAADWILEQLNFFQEDMKHNNFKNMLPLHAASSCLKAHTAEEGSSVIEVCRLACGGHGYSQASGFGKIMGVAKAMITAEGEATVLHLQTARYLLKEAPNAQEHKRLDPTLSYLTDKRSDIFVYCGDIDMKGLVQAIHHRAKRCIENAAARIWSLTVEGMERHDALNQSGVYLVQASKAHADAIVMTVFLKKLELLRQSNEEAAMLKYLEPMGAVYAIHVIIKNSGDFIQDRYISPSQLNMLKEKLYQLYDRIRPNAIAYVDAFDFRDRHLGSVLGRYDGDGYTHLYEWAKQAPLNQSEVHESFSKYMKPMREGTKKSNL